MSKLTQVKRILELMFELKKWVSPDLESDVDEAIDILESLKSDLKKTNGGNNVEWYTPPEIIDTVHKVMGRINLDPASCEIAQKTVQADKYFSKQDNGISAFWRGNVFCNPPYGKLTKQFMKKCTNSKYVNSAIFLVNRTGAAWYLDNLASGYWDAVCNVRKRIAFMDANGVVQASPRYYNDILYHGPYVELFCYEFSRYGECLRRNYARVQQKGYSH